MKSNTHCQLGGNTYLISLSQEEGAGESRHTLAEGPQSTWDTCHLPVLCYSSASPDHTQSNIEDETLTVGTNQKQTKIPSTGFFFPTYRYMWAELEFLQFWKGNESTFLAIPGNLPWQQVQPRQLSSEYAIPAEQEASCPCCQRGWCFAGIAGEWPKLLRTGFLYFVFSEVCTSSLLTSVPSERNLIRPKD